MGIKTIREKKTAVHGGLDEKKITNEFKAYLSVCLSMKSTNKGFEIEPDLMQTLARINLPLGFDVYYDE